MSFARTISTLAAGRYETLVGGYQLVPRQTLGRLASVEDLDAFVGLLGHSDSFPGRLLLGLRRYTPHHPHLPMRFLGQDPAKASTLPFTADQGERHPGAEQSGHESARSRGIDTPGVLANAVAAARGVPEAKMPAEPAESPEDLKAQMMEIDDRPICEICTGNRVVRTGPLP